MESRCCWYPVSHQLCIIISNSSVLLQLRYMNIFLSTWILLVAGLVFMLPQLSLRITNQTDEKYNRERRIKDYEAEIESLRSKLGQQVQKLRSVNPEAYRAYEWLRKNTERFEKQV